MRHLFSLLIISLCLGCPALSQPIGQKLPDFDFRSLSGEPLKLSEIRAKAPNGVVLLTFWCTDCSSCRTSEKHLSKLIKKYKGKARILAVASSRNDTPETVKRYLGRHKLKLPVVMDPGSKLGHHFNVQRTTTTVLTDKDGRVRYFGALLKRRKNYAEKSLMAVLRNGIVGQPIGPNFG